MTRTRSRLLPALVSAVCGCAPDRPGIDALLQQIPLDERLHRSLSPSQLEIVSASDEYRFRSSNGLNVSATKTGKTTVAIQDGPTSIRLSWKGAASSQSTVDRGRVLLQGATPCADFVLSPLCESEAGPECALVGVEWAVLIRHACGSTWRWELELKSLSASQAADGSISFRDGRGLERWRVPCPFAVDANGTRRQASATLEGTQLTVHLDTSGLAYPLLLDPSIESGRWMRPLVGVELVAGAAFFDELNQRVITFGGTVDGVAASNAMFSWNGRSWESLNPSTLPPPRHGHSIVYDTTRKRALLFGGTPAWPGEPALDTWEWDGRTWTQLASASYPSGRTGAGMAYDAARRQVVLFGGTGRFLLNNETWLWDGVNWTLAAPQMSPGPRMGPQMAYDAQRSRVVLVGGSGSDETWEWDGVNWSNRNSPIPGGRVGAVFFFDTVRGALLLTQGADSMGGPRADAWAWNGQTWTLLALGGGPRARGSPFGAFDEQRARLVLTGGWQRFGPALDDTWELAGSTWVEVPRRPPPRRHHVSAFDPQTNAVIIFGGEDQIPLTDTWAWDGGEWQQLSPLSSPPARARAMAATDFVRNRVVLFGGDGFGGITLNDTWEWDGADWHRMLPPVSPSPRVGGSLAWDADRKLVVLFGGGPFNDTWSWDGGTWTSLAPLPSPSPRYSPAMAWNPVDRQLVMFGGDGIVGAGGLNDTWTWDGTSWVVQSPSQRPLGRTLHAMAGNRMGVVLFGGSTSEWTWLWRRGNWEQQAGAMPQSRRGHTMVEDPVRHRIVLFGGSSNFGGYSRNDVWEYVVRGGSCTAAVDCDTGFCIDGVCCETACGGNNPFDCMACSRTMGAPADGECRALECRVLGPCWDAGSCDMQTGACSPGTARPNGSVCDDVNPCTTGDGCFGGACSGNFLADGAPCIFGSCWDYMYCDAGRCVPVLFYAGQTNGRPCNDGNSCTSDDRCDAGACVGRVLSDGTSCDDGLACTEPDRCLAGSCQPGAVSCPTVMCAEQPVCDAAAQRCRFTPSNGATCDDGEACTRNDVCSGARCGGTMVSCPGLGECWAPSSCLPDGGCSVIAVDGASCVGGTCASGSCLPDGGGDGGTTVDSGVAIDGGDDKPAGARGCGCAADRSAGSAIALCLALLLLRRWEKTSLFLVRPENPPKP